MEAEEDAKRKAGNKRREGEPNNEKTGRETKTSEKREKILAEVFVLRP